MTRPWKPTVSLSDQYQTATVVVQVDVNSKYQVIKNSSKRPEAGSLISRAEVRRLMAIHPGKVIIL